MSFAVGSLVRARGREWVVLPESEEELLILRPLGGTEEEVTGVYLPLEEVTSATFEPPDPEDVGDYRSCRLLRDAVRLGLRSSAGPFRSFGRIAVDPRPYQLVPLLMALRLDPVRLLIADDVGIGKTIEACLVARELLDRGEADRLAVLCPPHLAEQWQKELAEKFHIDAELVLASTASRLERRYGVGLDQSLFDFCPYTVVSMDFIKSDRRRNEFLRACPSLVIVDEAHTCAWGSGARSGRHQRHDLVQGLADGPDRHLILVTATPHSGKEETFRSLLAFLEPDFADLPADLSGKENEAARRRLAQHLVQRRRGDIRHFMDERTPFPEREEAEETYKLSPEYRRLFNRVLAYARETVRDPEGGAHRQRVRWWSALALLRALASSPAAAAATLRNRSPAAETDSPAEADERGRETVLDQDPVEAGEDVDVVAGADPGDEDEEEEARVRRRLLEMAREADALRGDKDEKVKKATALVDALVADGFRPIVFCRFIPTAEYVAEQFRERMAEETNVVAVTGALPAEERERRVLQLADSPRRVLVCTDCLSEGINLQEHFDAVVHYDLSWNPTRHEQRQGRVDRFGQERSPVRVLTYYGIDNQIDGIVVEVLIRKHRKIKNSLGYSVPVPADTNAVLEAVFEGLLLRETAGVSQDVLPGFEEYFRPKKEGLFTEWENAAKQEKRSRTMFAQETIKPEEVARELREARTAVGGPVDVRHFMEDAVRAHGGLAAEKNGLVAFDFRETPQALRDVVGRDSFEAIFDLDQTLPEGTLHLSRTHPVVEGVAAHVADTALDPQMDGVAHRAGAIRTSAVDRRTTLLLVRYRYHIRSHAARGEEPMLAEECVVLGYRGSPDEPEWLDLGASEGVLNAGPDANLYPDQARDFVRSAVEGLDRVRGFLAQEAERRAQVLLGSHRRVRAAARITGVRYDVEPQLPPDVLGVYVLVPAPTVLSP